MRGGPTCPSPPPGPPPSRTGASAWAATSSSCWSRPAKTGRDGVVVRTIAGDLPVEALPGGLYRADMGPARLGWRDVPLAREVDTLHLPLARGAVADPAACSMGNPH